VNEKDVNERFGIDHYYQVDVFVPLGNLVIQLRKPQTGKDTPTFTTSFPVTVCALRLPAGLRESENLSEDVIIPAVFFKVWSFRSAYVGAFEAGQRQPSPMFVAKMPQLVTHAGGGNSYVAIAACLILLAALLGLSYGLWRGERKDNQLRRRWFLRRVEVGGRRTKD